MMTLGCSTPWVYRTVNKGVYCPGAAMTECAELSKIVSGADPRDVIVDDRVAYGACKLQNTLKKQCIDDHNLEAKKTGKD